MNKLIAFSLLSFLAFHTYAQAPKWEIKKIGLSLGAEYERIRNLDYQFLTSSIISEKDLPYGDPTYGQNYMYPTTTNESRQARIELTLSPTRFRNTEVRTAITGVFRRLDAVSYVEQSDPLQSPDYQNFTSYGREISWEASLVKSANIKNIVYFYAGAGTTTSYGFGNKLSVTRSNLQPRYQLWLGDDLYRNRATEVYSREEYQQQKVFSQRFFAQFGTSLVLFKRIEIGLEMRIGVGHRTFLNADSRRTHLRAANLSAKWLLKP